MLGGLTSLNTLDTRNSKKLLQTWKLKGTRRFNIALDVACGIGRVTEEVLAHFYAKVDLLEQNSVFLEKAIEVKLAETRCPEKNRIELLQINARFCVSEKIRFNLDPMGNTIYKGRRPLYIFGQLQGRLSD